MAPANLEAAAYTVIDRLATWITRDKFTSILLIGGMGLLGANLVTSIAEVASIYRPELKPVAGATFGLVECIGMVLVGTGIASRVISRRHVTQRDRTDAAVELHSGFGRMSPAEKQIRFFDLYAVRPAANIIDALMSHPDDPVGVSELYKDGCHHVVWDKTWFRLRSRWHHWKCRLTIALFVNTSLFSVLSLAAGIGLIALRIGEDGRVTAGPALLAGGTLAAVGAAIYLNDIADYARAKHLVDAKPDRPIA